MSKKSAVFLRVLLNRFHQGPIEGAIALLPVEEREEMKNQTTLSTDIEAALSRNEGDLQKIHYSWLIPSINQLPKGVDSLVLASLPPPISDKLCKHLKKKPLAAPLSDDVRTFVLRTFAPYFVDNNEVLPIAYLPQSPLSFLLDLTKQQLTCMMDFLGLYDLALEVRHIVDKKILQKFQKCLTEKEREFLLVCLHKKDKLATAPIGLESWDGDCGKLRHHLHLRGLMRMGYALCGQYPDFIWHLSHKLDTGRGTSLNKYAKQPLDPDVIRVLITQVRHLTEHLNFTPKMDKLKRG